MKNRVQNQFPDSVIHLAKCEAMASTTTTNIRSKDHLKEFLENRFFSSSSKKHRSVPKSAPTTPAIEVSKDELSSWFKKLTMNMVSSAQTTESGTGSTSGNNNNISSISKKSGNNCINNGSSGKSIKLTGSGSKKLQERQKKEQLSSYDHLMNKSRNLFRTKERATSVGPLSRSKSSLWKQPEKSFTPDFNDDYNFDHQYYRDYYEPIYQNSPQHSSNNDHLPSNHCKSINHMSTEKFAQQQPLYSQPKRASFPQSKSMYNFSKSYHDLRNEKQIVQDKPITTKKRIKNLILNDNFKNSSLTPNHVPRKSSHSGSVSQLGTKPIAMSLLDFVSSQLQNEGIDLTEEPYTDQSGFCGIPPALVQRYAEETGRDLYEVADALDHIRLASLDVKGRRGIPNDFLADSCSGLVLEQANCENLTVWLTSLGLPMYHQHLVTNGWNNLQTVSRMKESDLLSVGILDKRHLRTMIRAISALNVTIQKISSCYEHNYESIPPPVSSTSPNQSTA